MQHYPDTHWQPLMLVALLGAVSILFGIALTVVQLVVSVRTRERRRDLTGDPWNGRTLEWSTSSPPPAWNFGRMPLVETTDAFWVSKQRGGERRSEDSYAPLHIPRNNPTGFFLAFFAVALGFALIWHIWWMAILGFGGALVVCVLQSWRTETEILVPAQRVAAVHGQRP
jgi:cytochrome o ubiquinol oxidase subunit 1